MKPPTPDWMPDLARAEWERVLAVVDVAPDALLLERHCLAYAAWREAEAELVATGRVIVLRDDKGNVRSAAPSPWQAIADRARAELTATSARLRL